VTAPSEAQIAAVLGEHAHRYASETYPKETDR